VQGDAWYFFTPSPDQPDLANYDYTEDECTVLAVHSLLREANLPADTFILAALILSELPMQFYKDWCELLTIYQSFIYKETTKELVIVAAIVPFSFASVADIHRSSPKSSCMMLFIL